MKKKIIYRSLPVILSFVTIFTVFCTPVSATSNLGLYSVDLMETDTISWGNERGNYPNIYNGFDWFTGNNIYFHWTPPVQNIKLQEIYITIYSSVNPRSPVLYPYDGATPINGTLISSYNSYYQYKFNIGVAIADLTFCSRYNSTERYFSLVSAQGYSNIYEPVTNFNVYGFEEYNTGGGDFDRVNFLTQTSAHPPFSYEHLYPGTDLSWDYYYIDIPRSSFSFNTYSQLTLVYDYVGQGIAPVVSLYPAGASEPKIVLDSSYVQTFTYSTHLSGTNNVEFTPITTQITVDLSEFDLSLYTIDLCLCIQPDYADSRTKQVTWINIRDIYLDQLVHEPTWYETFFGWIQKTLGINTDKIVNKLDDLFGDSSNGGIADSSQDIQDKSEVAQDELDEVITGIEEPEINFDEIFSFVPAIDVQSTNILTTIINIPEVLQITIISFVFMLAGLLIFGVKL